LSQNQYTKALEDYDTAITIQPHNAKYSHAKGITYEAMATQVEKLHGKRRRFGQESPESAEAEIQEALKEGESLQIYLRRDYVDFCNLAIRCY